MIKINNKIVGIITLTVIILGGVGAYFAFSPLDIAEQDIKNQIIFYNGQENYGKDFDPIDLRVKVNIQTSWKIVPLNNNWKRPLNPIYSLVFNEYKDKSGLSVAIFELSRDNIFQKQWKVQQYRMNQLNNYKFDQTIELVKTMDISNQNPDKDNISNISPFTQDQIESNRLVREKSEQNKKQNEINQKEASLPPEQIYNKLSPEDKTTRCEKDTTNLENVINTIETSPEEIALIDYIGSSGKVQVNIKELKPTLGSLKQRLIDIKKVCER
jgi:hypothetical protein